MEQKTKHNNKTGAALLWASWKGINYSQCVLRPPVAGFFAFHFCPIIKMERRFSNRAPRSLNLMVGVGDTISPSCPPRCVSFGSGGDRSGGYCVYLVLGVTTTLWSKVILYLRSERGELLWIPLPSALRWKPFVGLRSRKRKKVWAKHNSNSKTEPNQIKTKKLSNGPIVWQNGKQACRFSGSWWRLWEASDGKHSFRQSQISATEGEFSFFSGMEGTDLIQSVTWCPSPQK